MTQDPPQQYGRDFIIDKAGRRIPINPGAPRDLFTAYLVTLVEMLGYDKAFAYVNGRLPGPEDRP